ncbi:MAG: hypothetical protein DWQ10_18725 [Calditrichaeota bacterium]|nr:MAG: hypothetical protein DWQ10_18725 [Calditrichota bacterium]
MKHPTYLIIILTFLLQACSHTKMCISENGIVKNVNSGKLSPDIAILAIDNEVIACPSNFQGSIEECNKNSINDDYVQTDVYELLFSLFYSQYQYEIISDIIETDFFIELLTKLPDPDSSAIAWFNTQKNFLSNLVVINQKTSAFNDLQISELSVSQRKMISVFYKNNSWTYCPSSKKENGKKIHGYYKDKPRETIIYKTACNAKSIYETNIKDAAKTLRYIFISAHELCHAIDNEAGLLDKSTIDNRKIIEKRANIVGALLSRAVARLFVERINNYFSLVQEKPQLTKKMDFQFISCLKGRWQNLEDYFASLYLDTNNKELYEYWSITGCLKY